MPTIMVTPRGPSVASSNPVGAAKWARKSWSTTPKPRRSQRGSDGRNFLSRFGDFLPRRFTGRFPPYSQETLKFADPRSQIRGLGHPLICGSRTKSTRILFFLRNPHAGASDALASAAKGIARTHLAAVKPAVEPGHPLLRRAMGKGVRGHVTSGHLLHAVIPDGSGCSQRGLRVALFQNLPVGGRVGPYSCKAVRL